MILLRQLALPFLAAACCLGAFSARAETYELVVVPQFLAVEIHGDWQPLIEQIGAPSGVRLKFNRYVARSD